MSMFCFFFFCRDKWRAVPSQVWQIYVHFLERVDVSCVTGQRSCQSLVLRGKQAVRKIKCFSSHPKEIEVLRSTSHVLIMLNLKGFIWGKNINCIVSCCLCCLMKPSRFHFCNLYSFLITPCFVWSWSKTGVIQMILREVYSAAACFSKFLTRSQSVTESLSFYAVFPPLITTILNLTLKLFHVLCVFACEHHLLP